MKTILTATAVASALLSGNVMADCSAGINRISVTNNTQSTLNVAEYSDSGPGGGVWCDSNSCYNLAPAAVQYICQDPKATGHMKYSYNVDTSYKTGVYVDKSGLKAYEATTNFVILACGNKKFCVQAK